MSKRLTQEYIVMKMKNDRIQTIKNINLWGNDYDDVSIIQQMPSLEIISLSINKIRTLKPFANLPNLRELYLRKNMIGDINEVKYLTTCPNLRTLWLIENPIAASLNYRANVIQLLPKLIKLDDVVISDKERGNNDNNDPYQQQNQRDYSNNMRKQSSENAYSNHYNSPSYDRQMNINYQDYPNDNGLKRQIPSYSNNLYGNKGYNDDYNIGGMTKQSQEKYDYNNINNNNSHYYNQHNEVKYDNQNQPQDMYSNRPNKLNANGRSNNNRISNVTNCLLMLLKELNTNELEYVKGEIDKKINK